VLTWRFVLKNIVPIVAAVVAIVGNIFVHSYFTPDVRYQEGAYYRSGGRAITFLRLQNEGHADAEEIRVSASFPEPIADVTTSEEGLPFKVKSGGKGVKAVSGTIDRLVAGESVYVYFAIKNPEGPITESHRRFIAPKAIVYKGGMAKQGHTYSFFDYVAAVGLGLGILYFLMLLMGYYWEYRARSETASRPKLPHQPTTPPR
jgi:hypothetical protein